MFLPLYFANIFNSFFLFLFPPSYDAILKSACSSCGHSLSSWHQVSFPYDFIESFWIMLDLQMPFCGYIKMPSRPCGISHLHISENGKDREKNFFANFFAIFFPTAPAAIHGLGLWFWCIRLPILSISFTYGWSHVFLPIHVMHPPRCCYCWYLIPTAIDKLVQSWNFPLDYAFPPILHVRGLSLNHGQVGLS